MLYIVTALYEEALPFLKECSLKRDASFPHFELFSNDSTRLLITKPGAMRAAIAVSSLMSRYPANAQDFFLSVGTAACANRRIAAGSPFLIRKITDSALGRTYFPELLYRSPFPEAELMTVPSVQKTPPSGVGSHTVPLLFDMEGSGIYEASSTFFATHQIALCKVVSDHMADLRQFSPAELRAHITGCIAGNLPAILQWASDIQSSFPAPGGLGQEEASFFERACRMLRLSISCQNQLYQLMLYLHLAGIPYLGAMETLLRQPLQNGCKNKKEGKDYLEQLSRYFL